MNNYSSDEEKLISWFQENYKKEWSVPLERLKA